jgi:alcohol dehydrogenase
LKAVYFNEHGAIDVLCYGDFPEPIPPAGWVKVRVRAASLNHLDIFTRRGMPGLKLQLPGITGGDCAGEIAELGEGVTGWRIGERVLIYTAHVDFKKGEIDLLGETRNGALAEYCLCRASQLMRLPDGVTDELAACLPVAYGTAYKMMYPVGVVKPGETVLVLGASGGVGTATVILSKLAGAYVIACAGSDSKCERLHDIGADETINYAAVEFAEHVRQRTGSLYRGGGCDIVVNFTGGDTFNKSLRCVKHKGRVLVCGATAGHDARADLRFVMGAECQIIGTQGWDFEHQELLIRWVKEGRLCPPIDRVLPLSQAIDGIRALENREVFGKVVVKPQ